MADRPLEKPAHLRPEADGGSWIARRKAGALALALGVLSFVVVAVLHGELSSTPALWLTCGFPGTASRRRASLAPAQPRGYCLCDRLGSRPPRSCSLVP